MLLEVAGGAVVGGTALDVVGGGAALDVAGGAGLDVVAGAGLAVVAGGGGALVVAGLADATGAVVSGKPLEGIALDDGVDEEDCGVTVDEATVIGGEPGVGGCSAGFPAALAKLIITTNKAITADPLGCFLMAKITG